jgi:putative membrane protein
VTFLAAAAAAAEPITAHLHLDVLVLVVGAAFAYEYAIRRLAPLRAPRGEPAVTGGQRAMFYVGLAAILAVSTYPIHDIGEQRLFMFHMIEHMVLALVAPPLLLKGVPWWLLRMLVLPILPLMRVLTKPIVALLVFNGTLGLLHAPAVVEQMITGPDWFHLVMHALLFTTAILMWWPVIGPIPDLPQLPPFERIGYLFLQSLVPTIPASFLTLGDSALYKIYESFPRMWGISAHADQVLAGLIMKLGGGLILWAGIAAVFFTWWAEEQRYSKYPRRLERTP